MSTVQGATQVTINLHIENDNQKRAAKGDTPNAEFKDVGAFVKELLLTGKNDDDGNWLSNVFGGFKKGLDSASDAIGWAAENIAKPIANALAATGDPQLQAIAGAIKTGAEIAIAVDKALEFTVPDANARKQIAADAGAAAAEAASQVSEASKKSADPAKAQDQISKGSGFSDALQSLLAGGDLESLIMFVMAERASTLEDSIKLKFESMAESNKQLKKLNDEAATLQGKVTADPKDAASAEALTKKNGEITEISNRLQQEQIEMNGLISKLTQTFEAMSNYQKKFADTMSSLIRNI